MADNNLIRNANINAQKAVETAEKAMACCKELAPVQAEHAVEIARLSTTVKALSHFLFDAELTLIGLLLERGKPLSEHQQQVLAMRANLEGEAVQETPEPDPNVPVQLSLVPLSDESND